MSIPCGNLNLCIGCSVCSLVCPQHAIKMESNGEGFLMPVVNQTVCNDCGKCRQVCPVHAERRANAQTPRCFAACGPDEVRLGRSSSGGIFPVLAQKILMEGGVVCGAAWNEKWECQHIIIDSDDDLPRLQNSKYVQSDIGQCLPKIRELLDAGRKVLFSGTPCQAAALYSYLGKKYSELYTVDIVCHGVPSPGIWKSYLEENFDISQITGIYFRDKRKGWKELFLTIETGNGHSYSGGYRTDPYYNAFAINISLRKCCGTCRYCGFPRQADLTIGDYWGIDNIAPELNDKKGISVILENNIKGCFLLNSVKIALPLFKELPLESSYAKNPNIVKPSVEHPQREYFFKLAEQKSVTESLNFYAKDASECKIINYWYGTNYGAVLNCYALQQILIELNVSVKVINHIPKSWEKRHPGTFSDDFATRHLYLTRSLKRDELIELNNVTDTFITGSDQVFRYVFYKDCGGSLCQLSFVSPNKRRLSFSASFGMDYFEAKGMDRELFWHNLEQFTAISVRERSGVRLCSEEGIQAEHIIDPVFGIERETWDKLADEDKENTKKGGILYFALSLKKEELPPVLTMLAELLHTEVNVQLFDVKRSPETWLNSIRKAQFVVTDSFHAMCFSIIFHTPFLASPLYREEMFTRMKDILGILHLEKYCLEPECSLSTVQDLLQPIDWDAVDTILEKERQRMKEWLRTNLNAPIHPASRSAVLLSKLVEEKKQMEVKFAEEKKELEKKLDEEKRQLEEKFAGGKMQLENTIQNMSIKIGKTEQHLSNEIRKLKAIIKNIKKTSETEKMQLESRIADIQRKKRSSFCIFLKYYSYKMLSKLSSGKFRRYCLARRFYYKELLKDRHIKQKIKARIKYPLYKMLSKITSGKLRKHCLERRYHYKDKRYE